jgi:hypothetical protein
MSHEENESLFMKFGHVFTVNGLDTFRWHAFGSIFTIILVKGDQLLLMFSGVDPPKNNPLNTQKISTPPLFVTQNSSLRVYYSIINFTLCTTTSHGICLWPRMLIVKSF